MGAFSVSHLITCAVKGFYVSLYYVCENGFIIVNASRIVLLMYITTGFTITVVKIMYKLCFKNEEHDTRSIITITIGNGNSIICKRL